MSQDPSCAVRVLVLFWCLAISGAGRLNAQAIGLDHDPEIIDSGYGYAVALDSAGLVAIVGSAQATFDDDLRDNTGAVYVFRRQGGSWQRTQRLMAADVDMTDAFGSAVSLSATGRVGLVGAFMDENDGLAAGAAYVFALVESGFVEQTRLASPDPTPGGWFGSNVAINRDGTRGFVAARGENTSAGAVYIVEPAEREWSVFHRLAPSDSVSFAAFGHSLATDSSGGIVVIGAPGVEDRVGAAYVFEFNGVAWTESSRIQPSDAVAGNQFGYAVTLSADGTTAAIGAPTDEKAGRDAGSVYVYRRTDGTWDRESTLLSPVGPDGWFGRSLAIGPNGNVLAIGASADGRDAVLGGSVQVYRRNGSFWSRDAEIRKPDPLREDNFGQAIATNGDVRFALVGAPGDPRIERESGSVWVFDLSQVPTTAHPPVHGSLAALNLEAYPNPSRSLVQVRVYGKPRLGVRVEVFDSIGRRVDLAYEGRLNAAGSLSLQWRVPAASAGLYFVRASTTQEIQTQALILLE